MMTRNRYRVLIFILPAAALFLMCMVGGRTAPAYAEEGDSGIPGDYTQYVSMSEATPYPEPEIITIPIEDAEVYVMEEAQIPEEVLAALERERKEAENTVIINNLDDFRTFANNCADRMWSVEKKVFLETDLDLGNASFTPIPYFSGSFYGNRHTISGLSIKGSSSRAGLFATLTDTAVVTELRVAGVVKTTGKGIAGGIAGENYGKLHNVLFQGSVVSEYAAGGIAGLNLENAVISESKAGGLVQGTSCAGGICADNRGTVSYCENHAEITTGLTGFRKFLEKRECINPIAGISTGKLENCRDISGSASSALIKLSRTNLILGVLVTLGLTFLSGAVTLILTAFGKKKNT